MIASCLIRVKQPIYFMIYFVYAGSILFVTIATHFLTKSLQSEQPSRLPQSPATVPAMSTKNAEESDVIKKGVVFKKLRAHVQTFMVTSTFGISWPVSSTLTPLGIKPEDILRARAPTDVTWHDVPCLEQPE